MSSGVSLNQRAVSTSLVSLVEGYFHSLVLSDIALPLSSRLWLT